LGLIIFKPHIAHLFLLFILGCSSFEVSACAKATA
jgi:hypothetical protein